ncbi:MAG TPA: PadR family transcriptional regulator [Acidimicrobiales bacterium]
MTKEMREPTFLVLAALAGGKKHGYAIIRGVEELSDGEVELKAGTLYAMLDRLVFENVIEMAGDEVVDGRLRRYYQLTTDGASMLAVESKRRVVVSKEALRRLRLVGGVA